MNKNIALLIVVAGCAAAATTQAQVIPPAQRTLTEILSKYNELYDAAPLRQRILLRLCSSSQPILTPRCGFT
jgi:hypothetical protein